MLRVWIKVADEWLVSLVYVRGSNIYVRGYFGFACLVLKTTYIDRRKALWDGAFFLTRTMLFPSQDKRNTRDKAKGLCVSSERHIGELGMRCLSTLNRVQDYRQSLIRRDRPMKTSRCMLRPPLRCGVRYMGQKKYLTLFLVAYIYSVRARIGGESAFVVV